MVQRHRLIIAGLVIALLTVVFVMGTFARDLDAIVSSGVIRVGFYPQDPPKQYYDPDTGEAVGLEVDIAKEFASDLGVKLELIGSEWDALIPGLLADKWDIVIANMCRLPSRAATVDFTLAYENIDGMAILVRADDDRFTAVSDLNQAGIKIGVNRGSAGHMCADKNAPAAEILPFQSASVAAMALQVGQLDAVVEDVTTMELYAREHPQLKVVGTSNLACPCWTGFAIQPGNFRLWLWANQFLIEFKVSGRYSILYEKWFPERVAPTGIFQ